MRIAIIADVHVGNFGQFGGAAYAGINDRCRVVLGSLAAAAERARDLDCDRLIVAGDLFETSYPSPPIVAAVARALQSFGKQIELVVGNHDANSTSAGDHAMAALAGWDRFIIYEQPARSGGVVFLPYNPSSADDWLPDALKLVGPNSQLLVAHLGVMDGRTPAFLAGAYDAIHVDLLRQQMGRYGIRDAVVGNWHFHQRWGTVAGGEVIQVGALAPIGFGDRGTGMMAIWDSDASMGQRFTIIDDIPGPRWVRVMSLSGLRQAVELPVVAGCIRFVRAFLDPDDIDDALRVECPSNVRIEVLTDATITKAQARTAATVAKHASTLDEALDGFMEEVPIAEPATRAGVADRVRRYAARARSLS